MLNRGKSLASAVVVLLGGATLLAACPDPGKLFTDFDERVFDASSSVITTGCNGGEIPNIAGEYYLTLSPVVAPDALLERIVTTEIDATTDPATLSMNLQELCTQSDQCTVGQPVGEPHLEEGIEIDDQCGFTANIASIIIDGGANTLSGSEIDGELELIGSLQADDFYCGIVNGVANVGGAPIPIDNSTFGAIGIETGTLGDDLPEPIPACPEEQPVDAGATPDANLPDAML